LDKTCTSEFFKEHQNSTSPKDESLDNSTSPKDESLDNSTSPKDESLDNSTSPKDECHLRSLKNSQVLVLSKFHEKSSYYGLIIYIKMFETIVLLTYVYSEPSTDKVFLALLYHIIQR
jgi:hypothetical protein